MCESKGRRQVKQGRQKARCNRRKRALVKLGGRTCARVGLQTKEEGFGTKRCFCKLLLLNLEKVSIVLKKFFSEISREPGSFFFGAVFVASTRSFLCSPCTHFNPTDFCHLPRRLNCFLICWFANFGLNDLKSFVLLQFMHVQFQIMIC